MDEQTKQDVRLAIEAIRNAPNSGTREIVVSITEVRIPIEGDSASDPFLRDIRIEICLNGASRYVLEARKAIVASSSGEEIWNSIQNAGLDLCSLCGEKIPPGRIAAVPETTLCTACAARR